MTAFMLVAGETSGDQLGAHLLQELKHHFPQAHCFGMGGAQMNAQGLECLVNAEDMAIVGIWEVVKKIRTILSSLRQLKIALLERRPRALILIDYPDFNLHLAAFAARHSIKVLYYVSPQIWAWRPRRIRTIKRCVDHMAVLFPFEKELYQKARIPVSVVGHPLIDRVPQQLSTSKARALLTLPQESLVIGLLPGSRHQEIHLLLPILLDSAKRLKTLYPHAQFLLPLASHLSPDKLTLDSELGIHVTQNHYYETIKSCNAVICASGTATLEVALLQIPMVIIYKVSSLSYQVGKWLIKTPFVGLCNIIAKQAVCQELLQHQANASSITQAIVKILEDALYRQDMLAKLKQSRFHLGNQVNLAPLIALATQAVHLSAAAHEDLPKHMR